MLELRVIKRNADGTTTVLKAYRFENDKRYDFYTSPQGELYITDLVKGPPIYPQRVPREISVYARGEWSEVQLVMEDPE